MGTDTTKRDINPTQGRALSSNIAAVPQIDQLSDMINEIISNQWSENLGRRIPGAAGLEATSSGNIASALEGQLDPSVINLLGQQSAERGIGTGSPMGAGANADYLRSLGLTSLDLMGTGQEWLTGALGRNPAAPMFDPGSMVLTPEQLHSIERTTRPSVSRATWAPGAFQPSVPAFTGHEWASNMPKPPPATGAGLFPNWT